MPIPFVVIEDADVPCTLESECRAINPEWICTIRSIRSPGAYQELLKWLSSGLEGPAITVFDLDYSDYIAHAPVDLPHWNALSERDRDELGPKTRFGFEALITGVRAHKSGDLLVVVCSQLAAEGNDQDGVIRTHVNQGTHEANRRVGLHVASGPLVKESKMLERLRGISQAWDMHFGSLQARLMPASTRLWFNDEGAPRPRFMVHASVPDDLREHGMQIDGEVTQWLASVLQTTAHDAGALIRMLEPNAKFRFYKDVLQHLTGACALQHGRCYGKPLNLPALAFIACVFVDRERLLSVFGDVNWALAEHQNLLDSSADPTVASQLLNAFVGPPDATPAGILGCLGIHTGQDGGHRGAKTVIGIVLETHKLVISFAINGLTLADKLSAKEFTGTASCKIGHAVAVLARHDIGLSWAADESRFSLTISK